LQKIRPGAPVNPSEIQSSAKADQAQ
ncbi:MAG: membrane fusion protein (multidrug efflux system), partial [Gammaproteobacteria bacterium]